MNKNSLLGILIFMGLLLIALSGWFFTLLIDWSMLLIMGYIMSFFVYRFLSRRWKWMGVAVILLLPVTILSLYAGGILPYFDKMMPEQVYFHLLPKEILGITGNDFMWNGFLLVTVGRVVPLSIQPTYQYLGFNIFAALIWLGMLIVLPWASLRGYADSTVPTNWLKVFVPGLLKMVVLAVVTNALLISISLLLVWLYS